MTNDHTANDFAPPAPQPPILPSADLLRAWREIEEQAAGIALDAETEEEEP